MHYANLHPYLILYSLLIVVAFYIRTLRRRKILMERFAEKRLIEGIAPGASTKRKILKMSMMVLAIFLALIALARPQWGFEWEEQKRASLDMIIAIDVSKSMLAKDVKPNRLERSKFAVKDLLKKLSGDRVGLIAFSGTAFLQCPLTIDYNGFLLALDDLSVGTIPRGGTSIDSAIRQAMEVFRGPEKKYKVLVIITDGEELEGDAIKAAEEASRLGIKIYCVGVGTGEGELIPVIDETGQRTYLSDNAGAIVKTRLNEEVLKSVAVKTEGNYVRATQNEFGLILLYDRSISKLEKRDIEARMEKRYQERFQIFLGLALAILFIEPLISEKKRILS